VVAVVLPEVMAMPIVTTERRPPGAPAVGGPGKVALKRGVNPLAVTLPDLSTLKTVLPLAW
jgi:hypothetical protein